MIFCCGEALVDMIQDPATGGFLPHPGGAALNSAVALGRLGQPVGLIAGLSDDQFGVQLMSHARDHGVDDAWIVHNRLPTTLAFVHLMDGDAQYSFYDRHTAGREIDFTRIPALPKGTQALLLGGISLIVDPSASAFARLADEQAGRSVIMLDPNIRPDLINDASEYRRRLTEMANCADIIKLSEEDIAWLGEETQLIGCAITLITRAERGATARLMNGVQIDVAAPAIEVVDTVGAGDTFNAAFLTMLRENGWLDNSKLKTLGEAELRQTLDFACRAASLSVARAGAMPPSMAEIQSTI